MDIAAASSIGLLPFTPPYVRIPPIAGEVEWKQHKLQAYRFLVNVVSA
jgi:hypothetical protein